MSDFTSEFPNFCDVNGVQLDEFFYREDPTGMESYRVLNTDIHVEVFNERVVAAYDLSLKTGKVEYLLMTPNSFEEATAAIRAYLA